MTMESYLKVSVITCLLGWSYAIDTKYISESCNGSTVIDSALQLETAKSLSYSSLMNCYYTVTLSSAKRILAVFNRFEMEPKVNGVCTDYLNIYDGADQTATLLNSEPLCGITTLTKNVSSSGTSMMFHIKTDKSAVYMGFSFILTAVEDAPCTSGQFACSNGLCIDSVLKCDDYNQCGDKSDENDCQAPVASTIESSNTPMIIGLVIGIVALLGIIAAIILHVYKKNQWKKFLHQNLEDPDVWNASPSYPVTRKYYTKERGNYNTLSNDNYIDGTNISHPNELS